MEHLDPAPLVVGFKPAVAVEHQQTRRPCILLAEDDDDLRALMRAFLEFEGNEVLACGHGRRALQVFQSRSDIDLIISDLEMPHLKGVELAHMLQASRPSLFVILMSGHEPDEELRAMMAADGWMFLPKPFPVHQMLATILHLLHGRTPVSS